MEAQAVELGPVDLVVIAYPADAPMSGEAIPLILNLVDQGIIRILDVLFVTENDDGTYSGFAAQGLDSKGVGELSVFEGASSGLLGEDDVATAGAALDPGSAAVLILYENTWAAPVVAAIRRNGGVVIDNQRISAQELLDALDAVDAAA